MSDTLTCLVCEDDIHDSAPIMLNDFTVCLACFESHVKPQFVQALADESSYPVKWTGQEVSIDSIREHFDDHFLAKWSLMQAERSVLPKDRHYCAGSQCGNFLGTICSQESIRECPSCHSSSCGTCATLIVGSTKDHRCATGSNSDPFEGLTKGRDYQMCPNCSTAVYLTDGCNHITCVVPACRGTGFCYICGGQADHDSGHWEVGNPCPRYNHPQDNNAIYDDDNLELGVIDILFPQLPAALQPPTFEDFAIDDIDTALESLRPPPTADHINDVTAELERLLDRPMILEADRLFVQDTEEVERLLDAVLAHALTLDDDVDIAEAPQWLRNFDVLLNLLWAGVGIYGARIIYLGTRPLGEEFRQQFVRQYDSEVDNYYRLSEQARAIWPSINAIYDRYKLAVADRMEELEAQAPVLV